MLEKGSGEGVTAARTAVLPEWAARAMRAPRNVARSCSAGLSWAVGGWLDLGVARLPVRQTLREHGSGCQEGRHLLFDQLMLLHGGGQDDLR